MPECPSPRMRHAKLWNINSGSRKLSVNEMIEEFDSSLNQSKNVIWSTRQHFREQLIIGTVLLSGFSLVNVSEEIQLDICLLSDIQVIKARIFLKRRKVDEPDGLSSNFLKDVSEALTVSLRPMWIADCAHLQERWRDFQWKSQEN